MNVNFTMVPRPDSVDGFSPSYDKLIKHFAAKAKRGAKLGFPDGFGHEEGDENALRLTSRICAEIDAIIGTIGPDCVRCARLYGYSTVLRCADGRCAFQPLNDLLFKKGEKLFSIGALVSEKKR
jgi:hypothetical protein